jgi:hypothetical protein
LKRLASRRSEPSPIKPPENMPKSAKRYHWNYQSAIRNSVFLDLVRAIAPAALGSL